MEPAPFAVDDAARRVAAADHRVAVGVEAREEFDDALRRMRQVGVHNQAPVETSESHTEENREGQVPRRAAAGRQTHRQTPRQFRYDLLAAVVRVVVDQDQLPFDSPPGPGAVRPSAISQTTVLCEPYCSHKTRNRFVISTDGRPSSTCASWSMRARRHSPVVIDAAASGMPTTPLLNLYDEPSQSAGEAPGELR